MDRLNQSPLFTNANVVLHLSLRMSTLSYRHHWATVTSRLYLWAYSAINEPSPHATHWTRCLRQAITSLLTTVAVVSIAAVAIDATVVVVDLLATAFAVLPIAAAVVVAPPVAAVVVLVIAAVTAATVAVVLAAVLAAVKTALSSGQASP